MVEREPDMSIEENGQTNTGEAYVEIITSHMYKQRFQEKTHNLLPVENITHAKYCKADVLSERIEGVFAIPQKKNLTGKRSSFGFCLTEETLLFVDDEENVKTAIDHIVTVQKMEKTLTAHFFFEFLEYLIKEDMIFLQKYEERLSKLEEELLKGTIENFNKKILTIRKEILILQSYYEQLMDISDMFEENQNGHLSIEDCRLFGLFSKRVHRLCDSTKMLKEYSLQLREMYEAQIATRQNEVMKVLTIVTTIFMPLTLIAGWYGMNFVNMPELRSTYGYMAIVGVSIITILIEIWIFKIKKWF